MNTISSNTAYSIIQKFMDVVQFKSRLQRLALAYMGDTYIHTHQSVSTSTSTSTSCCQQSFGCSLMKCIESFHFAVLQ